MSGHTTLWNPGCDHAGIATQVSAPPSHPAEEAVGNYAPALSTFSKLLGALSNSLDDVLCFAEL